MFCSGRTQRIAPLPQRIDFGQANDSMVAGHGRRAARPRCCAPRPCGSRSSSQRRRRVRTSAPSSVVSPADFMNPSSARCGAPVCGPLRSSTTSGWRSGKPSTTSVSRRGVTYDSARVELQPFLGQPRGDARAGAARRRRPASAPGSPRRTAPVEARPSLRSIAARRCARASSRSTLSRARARGRCRPARSVTLITPRASSMLNTWLAVDALRRTPAAEDRSPAARCTRLPRRRSGAAACPMFGVLEVVGRELALVLEEHVAVRDALGAGAPVVVEVVHVLDALHVHREPLEPVRVLHRHRIALDAADLLEVRVLADFHAVAPHFPAQPPRAQRRALPVVLDEADVVRERIDPDPPQALQIELLRVRRATA